MSLKLDKDYEDSLIKHGYRKIITSKGLVYFIRKIKGKKEIDRIETIKKSIQDSWDISTTSLFRKALVEYSLINYLETIKPYYYIFDYYNE